MKEKKLPKFNYYDEFVKNADIAVQMSVILKDFINNYDNGQAKEIEKTVHKLENDADDNLLCLLNFLAKDFLPPIDREDIVLLANKIDDAIDCIDETVIGFNIFNIITLREGLEELIEHINKLCLIEKEILTKLKSSKKYDEINELVTKVNKLEDEGNRLYEKNIRKLFKEENVMEILKWEKIYSYIEKSFDALECIADTVGEIVMKNA